MMVSAMQGSWRLPVAVFLLVFPAENFVFAESVAANERPNILLIITDQQHADMMSCAGNRWLSTPGLDGLADRGVRFERAYCGNPVCVPSRFSMMTGTLPSRIGMEHNRPASYPVPPEILDHALGNLFHRGGYQTVYSGKIHLPGTREKGIAAYGFERLISENERGGLVDACERFFEEEHRKPFLLVASLINPHDICYMAIDAYTRAEEKPLMYPHSRRERECLAEAMKLPEGVSRESFFAERCPPLPANFEIPEYEPSAARSSAWRPFREYVQNHWNEEDWRLHRWAYARLTEMVDAHIERLLRALEHSGLQENTLVVFTSDHGDLDAAHRLEHKSMPYDEASRVPLIVAQSGVTPQGKVDDEHLISTGLDLIPTLCDFAGIPVPETLDGRSFRAWVVPDEEVDSWRECLVFENEGSRTVVTDRHKYSVYGNGEPREMLVDLENDPGEMINLAVDPDSLDTLRRHRQQLRKWYAESHETLPEQYIVRETEK
jgi:choline-sulfatase